MKKNNSFIPVLIFTSGVRRLMKIWSLFFLLNNIIFLSFVIAQENRITTFFPTYPKEGIPSKLEIPTNGLQLYFNHDSFPKSGKITNAFINLTTNNTDSAGKETIQLFINSGCIGQKSLTSYQAQKENTTVSIPINNLEIPPDRLISFTLKSTGNANRRTWHSNLSDSSKFRPRLVIEYTVPGEPVTQSDGLPYVRSTKAFLSSVQADSTVTLSYGCRQFPKAYSYTPAFYNGKVYLITDDGGKKSLGLFDAVGNKIEYKMLDSLGKELSVDFKSSDGQHLLISKEGCLYIVGDNRILCYRIDKQQGTPTLTLLYDSMDDNPKMMLNPVVPPAVGPDGSLYFVNGLEAYGLNSDLQELWKVTLKDMTTSPLTIGPSGKYVYLVTKGEGLVAINAQTGELVESSLPNQQTLRSCDNPVLFAPIVIRHPDGTEKIYVAANSTNDGVLTCYKNSYTTNQTSSDSLKIKLQWNNPGKWGQPIVDQLQPESTKDSVNVAEKIYAVHVEELKNDKKNDNGTLLSVNWFNEKDIHILPSFDVDKKSDLININDNVINTPVIDQAGHCLVWNGSGKIGLYRSSASGTSSGCLDTECKNASIARLFFGSDGTLYAYSTDKILMALIPKYTYNKKGADISSTTHLMAFGTIDSTQTATMKAGGGVFLAPGFAVQKGATLKISTGTAK